MVLCHVYALSRSHHLVTSARSFNHHVRSSSHPTTTQALPRTAHHITSPAQHTASTYPLHMISQTQVTPHPTSSNWHPRCFPSNIPTTHVCQRLLQPNPVQRHRRLPRPSPKSRTRSCFRNSTPRSAFEQFQYETTYPRSGC